MTDKKILVTGCTGHIGSQTVVQLLRAGHEVVILDDLSNSKPSVVDRIERIAGESQAFIHGDIRDRDTLEQLFAQHSIDAVMHFTCLKAVGESEAEPLKYFHTNVASSIALFDETGRAGVRTGVFFRRPPPYTATLAVLSIAKTHRWRRSRFMAAPN